MSMGGRCTSIFLPPFPINEMIKKKKQMIPLHTINLVDMITRINMKQSLLTLVQAVVLVGWMSSSISAQCAINGDTSTCQTGVETYSIASPAPGAIYGWMVTGGTIVGDAYGSSVDVEWGTTPGSYTVSASANTPGTAQNLAVDFDTECLDLETNGIMIRASGAVCGFGDVYFDNGVNDFIVTSPGATIAYDPTGTFDLANRCIADGLTYSSTQVMIPNVGVYYITTSDGNIFALGNIVTSATNVDFDSKQLSASCGAGESCTLNVNIEGDATLGCNGLVHISMDENCRAVISADMLLEGETLPNSSFIVNIYMPSGATIPNATLTSAHVGMTLDYRVTQECTGNTCWGQVLVEDKLIPELECRDMVIEAMCGESLDPEDVGFPLPLGVVATRVPNQNEFVVSGFDPCGDVWLSYSDDITKNGCGSTYYTEVVRSWKAEDAAGNVTTCTETIGITPGSLAGVVFPPNFDGINRFALECDFKETLMKAPLAGIGSPSVNIGWNTLDNMLPSPYPEVINSNDTLIGTGYPTGAECEHIAVSYRDRVIETCGPNTYKLFRTWKVYDWCTGEGMEHLQLIKVVDTRAPQLSCNPNNIVEVISAEPWTCKGVFQVPDPIVDSKPNNTTAVPVILRECSGWSYTVRHKVADVSGDAPGDCINIPTSGAFETGNVREVAPGKYEVFDMPYGCNWIEYIITDDCGNVSVCRFDIFVEDAENPVAVCDEHTVVSLNEQGEAQLCAPVVDNGSLDNCTAAEDLRFEIKLMSESDSRFRDCIEFDCNDVAASPIMVVFRVYDEAGNSNDCMVEVTVQDKIAPQITCAPTAELQCGDDYLDDDVTGRPTVDDQCGNTTVTSSILRESLNDCGIGFVIKRWRVEDAGGRFAICDQRINITDNDPFDGTTDIVWPKDYTLDGCTAAGAHPNNLPLGFDWPTYDNKDCAKPVAGYTDDPFKNVNGTCIVIKRTWEVIDWCQYDIINSTGPIWRHVQTIYVDDNTPPMLDNGRCENRTVCAEANCEGQVVFNMVASDNCTLNEDLEWRYEVRDGLTNAFIEAGVGNSYDKFLEVGRYQFTWTVKDACGNEDDCISIVTIEDCKEPTPYCKPGIVTTIMPSAGYVEVWATDFNDGSFDNCTDTADLRFSFSSDLSDIVRRIDCDSLANGIADTFEYQMWVTDLDNNQDYCTVTIIVQDNQNRCPNTGNLTGSVAGLITTTIDDEVEAVEVNLMHNGLNEKMMETEVDGKFTFNGLTYMDEYQVAPYKNDEPLNGVSTADLVIIQRHLLGQTEFTQAEQYIAADANNSESVSSADISEIRKLILGVNAEFKSNTSWRFIDADQVFTDQHDPWTEGLKESIDFDPLMADMMDTDFKAIKIGDLNESATPHGATSNGTRSSNELTLIVEDQVISQGEESSVKIEVSEDMDLSGLQFTLEMGEALNFVALESGVLTVNESNYHVNEQGVITFAWGNAEAQMVEAGATLFEIRVSTMDNVVLSESMELNSDITVAEAYDQTLEGYDLTLDFSSSKADAQGLALYQNIPNPFNASTIIPFELAQDAPAQITIFDVNGKTILVAHINGKKGYNEFELSASQLKQAGVLYYQLESNKEIATRRMLNLN